MKLQLQVAASERRAARRAGPPSAARAPRPMRPALRLVPTQSQLVFDTNALIDALPLVVAILDARRFYVRIPLIGRYYDNDAQRAVPTTFLT